jgi:hypothetical protein
VRALTAAAAVPAAPLMLPAASPRQPDGIRHDVAELRGLAAAAIAGLPEVDAVVLVAAGPRGIYDSASASLAPLGVAGAEVELPVAVPVIEHLSRLIQYPMFRGDPLSLDHSVLALQLHAVRGKVPALPLNVPPTADFDVLVSVGASIGEAVADTDLTAAVLAASDLSAGLDAASPAAAVDGAEQWDAAVVAAVQRGELGRLRDLGPEEAERVAARGWAPLAVLHGVCAVGRLQPQLLGYLAPRGVGQLVARCVAREAGREPFEAPADGEHQGVVPRTGDARG